VIDQNRRKIAVAGWTSEYDRPIYFLEHREGYICCWCTLAGDRLLVQPHPASHRKPEWFAYPNEIEVIGQVIGVAMSFENGKRRAVRP
jgi:hypothetical protein